MMRDKNKPRFLLVQCSPQNKSAGKWMLPGGHIENYEKPLCGIERELQEETGIIVRLRSCRGILRQWCNVFSYSSIYDSSQMTESVFETRTDHGETSDFGWTRFDENIRKWIVEDAEGRPKLTDGRSIILRKGTKKLLDLALADFQCMVL